MNVRLCHLIINSNFRPHLDQVQPGIRFKDLTLDDAVASMDMEMVNAVLPRTGLTKLQRYHTHMLRAASQGDACIDVLRFLLENKDRLCGPQPFKSRIIQFVHSWPHDMLLELLFEFAHYWDGGFDNLVEQVTDAYTNSKDEFYARLLLKHHRDPTRIIDTFTPYCTSTDFVDELVAVATNAGSETYAVGMLGRIFNHTVRRAHMPVLRHLCERYYDQLMDSGRRNDCRWFVRMLLMKPITPKYKEALIYTMSALLNGTKDKISFALYMLNDEDLINQPYPVDVNTAAAEGYVTPSQFYEMVLQHGCENIPVERLSELVNEHISERDREALRNWTYVPRIRGGISYNPRTMETLQALLPPRDDAAAHRMYF